MIYEWKCKFCDFKVEVSRTVEECNKPPFDGELHDSGNDIYTDHLIHYDEEITGNHEPHWVRVYSASVPFQTLRDRGVFMDENGNYPPRKID